MMTRFYSPKYKFIYNVVDIYRHAVGGVLLLIVRARKARNERY